MCVCVAVKSFRVSSLTSLTFDTSADEKCKGNVLEETDAVNEVTLTLILDYDQLFKVRDC